MSGVIDDKFHEALIGRLHNKKSIRILDYSNI